MVFLWAYAFMYMKVLFHSRHKTSMFEIILVHRFILESQYVVLFLYYVSFFLTICISQNN